jgi:hypothetical protein
VTVERVKVWANVWDNGYRNTISEDYFRDRPLMSVCPGNSIAHASIFTRPQQTMTPRHHDNTIARANSNQHSSSMYFLFQKQPLKARLHSQFNLPFVINILEKAFVNLQPLNPSLSLISIRFTLTILSLS